MMNSITYGIGPFLAILVVNVFSTDYTIMSEQKVTVNSPFNFVYLTCNNFLLMEITLKNISPSVTDIHLKYNKITWSEKTLDRVKVNIEKNTSEVKFMILKHFKCYQIVVEVELYSQQRICDTTNIADGRSVDTMTWMIDSAYPYQNKMYMYKTKYYFFTEYCLAPKPCEIVVDLKNKCQDEQTFFICNMEKSQYICTFTDLQNTSKHRFYQTYDNNSFVGPVPVMKAKTTKIVIQLELFDNNTSVNVASMPLVQNEYNIIWSNKLSLTAKDISEDYSNVTKRRYSETKHVEYSCQDIMYETKYLHVGFINITSNKITTQNKTKIKKKFKMADNGTILCCLYYVFAKTYSNEQEVLIRRYVDNKILLIYQSQESISTNRTESKEQTTTPQTDWLIYLVPSFLGICVLVLALYIIKQKRCCKHSYPVEEAAINATQNQVLYANLDFVRDENPPQAQNEESHYANIIGVLHPL